jgi:hypothetical protein
VVPPDRSLRSVARLMVGADRGLTLANRLEIRDDLRWIITVED